MDLIIPFSFSDFPEDVQIRILSFLNPWELESFARISTRFLNLCRDDERLWYLKCIRQWGSHTQIQKWGGSKISYRQLYHFLENYEKLIGFWQTERYSTMSTPKSPSLALFEWGSFYITGYRILLSKYSVMKKPFLWITATSDGKAMSYLDTDGRVSLTDKDLSKEDSEKLLRGGLILVNVRFCGDQFLGLGEIPQYLEFRRRSSTRVEYESVYRSPPDELMSQIHQTLANKLSVSTGDPTSTRAKKKERQREREKWRRVRTWVGQSFRKITECCPIPSRPLQGLWKGIGPDGSLNLYLVCYRQEWNKVLCEKVEGSSTENIQTYSDVVFTASCTAFIESPYSVEEESMYDSRVHLRPCVEDNHRAGHIDVQRIFYAHSGYYNPYPSEINSDDADGRIWFYADGTFGFGFLQDDYILDLKHVTTNGCLLDIMM